MPEATPEPDRTPGSEVNPRRERLALLVRLRARGLISDQAFLAQKRMLLGADPLLLPAAPASPVTPVRKKHRRWKTLLGVAFLILLGLGLLRRAWLPPGSSAGLTEAPPPDAPVAQIDSPQEDVYPLGKPFQTDECTYAITGYRTATTLGTGPQRVSAAENDAYVLVNFTVRNDSDRRRALPTDAFKLQDANGAVYRGCGEAATARLALEEGQRGWIELSPGGTKRLVAAFEVPVTASRGTMKLVIPEEDLFAPGQAVVYLKLRPGKTGG
jgi:hypothetical protein